MHNVCGVVLHMGEIFPFDRSQLRLIETARIDSFCCSLRNSIKLFLFIKHFFNASPSIVFVTQLDGSSIFLLMPACYEIFGADAWSAVCCFIFVALVGDAGVA